MQAARAGGSEQRRHEAVELGLDRLALLLQVRPGNAGVVLDLDGRAVVELDGHLGQRVRPVRLEVDRHLVAQVLDARLLRHRLVVGFEVGGIDAGQRHRHGLAQRELRLEARRRIGDVADLVGAGVDPEQDLPHALGREVVLQPDLLGALDGRVRQVAGGVVLEEVVAQVPARRRLAECRLGVHVIALRGGETLVAFQQIAARREAPGGEPRRAQPVLGSGAGMQRLAHGAEVRLEAGRLRRGDPEGDGKLAFVQAQHAAGGCGRGEGADRAGDVEALLIVAGCHEPADPARGFVTGDEALDEQAARSLHLFAEGQQGGDDRDRRMAAHREVHVVVVEGVAGRAIDQRRRGGQYGL